MRLIDADDAKRTYTVDMFDTKEDFERVNDVLDYAPIVDAVVVTRCKDCKFRRDRLYCRLRQTPEIVANTDFCSYGKPKEKSNGQ